MRVELVIDEVVLHGFDPRDRHRIGDAIERQLTARLADDSVAGRIVSGARHREQTVANVVKQSVRAAVAPPTARSR